MKENKRRWLTPVLTVAALALSSFLLYRIFSRYNLDEVISSLGDVPLRNIVGALGFAAASYACLTLFDWLGTRYAGKPLPYRRCAVASFCALSLGHNIGFAAVSSGAVRYRFYARYGLQFGDVARVILFCGVTVALGMITTGGIALIAEPQLAETMTGVQAGYARGAGLGLLALVALYLLACAFVRGELTIRRWTVELPPLRLAVPQVAVATVNFMCVAACLHQAVLALADVGYFKVAASYILANTAALVSHVPGGLGVIESVVLLLLPDSGLLAALVVFRLAYYLVPLVFGASLLAGKEIAWRRSRDGAAAQAA